MKQEIKIGVIGAGVFNQAYHSPALKALKEEFPGLRLRGICDLDIAKAEKFIRQFGYEEAFDDYNKMLDADDFDGLYITVKPKDLCSIVLDIAKQNLPVFMEKPPGLGSQETRQMADALGAPSLVGFNRRHMPLNQKLREYVMSLRHVTFINCQFYRYKRREERFAFGTGIHGIDMMLYLGGAVNWVDTIKKIAPGKNTPQYLVTFHYASGAIGTMHICPEVGCIVERYEVHGDEKSLLLHSAQYKSPDFPGKLETYDGREKVHVDHGAFYDPDWETTGIGNQARAFIRHLLEGSEMHPSLGESVTAMMIGESVLGGKPIVAELRDPS
jgi:predicted dehydrogenase